MGKNKNGVCVFIYAVWNHESKNLLTDAFALLLDIIIRFLMPFHSYFKMTFLFILINFSHLYNNNELHRSIKRTQNLSHPTQQFALYKNHK